MLDSGASILREAATNVRAKRSAWLLDTLAVPERYGEMSRELVGSIRVGVSGWRYASWRGVFYPPDLPQRLELWYASRTFTSIEINGTFYSLQHPASFSQWYADTPPGFVFSVKGPRFITHMKRLRDVERPLASFFASGLFNLKEKLGPILWQLPPQARFDAALLAGFCELLPRNSQAALELARKRDRRMKGRARLAIDANRPLRHALEVRHESFVDARFVELLRHFRIGLVIADTAKRWPMLQDVTADFVYIRLHGDKALYQSGYSDRALKRWASRIAAWHAGKAPPDIQTIAGASTTLAKPRDVFCYFDNTDVKLRAPRDAQSLMRKLGLKPLSTDDLSAPSPSQRRARQRRPMARSSSGSSRMSANVR